MTQTNPQKAKQPRIERVEIDGRAGWLKRPEKLGLSLRLRKGDPQEGFKRELQTYRDLQGRDLPIPELLDDGDDFFVVADAGPNLNRIFRDTSDTPEVFHNALAKAARALARLHEQTYCHGRPALKDICWDGTSITFIDLDRARPGDPKGKGYALDVLIFFFSAISVTDGVRTEVIHARDAYKQADAAGNWQRAVRLARRLRYLAWALTPITMFLQSKREFRAIAPTLRFMTAKD